MRVSARAHTHTHCENAKTMLLASKSKARAMIYHEFCELRHSSDPLDFDVNDDDFRVPVNCVCKTIMLNAFADTHAQTRENTHVV